MIRVIAAAAAVAIGVTTVHAQNAAAIAKRQETMKAFGTAVKAPGAMARGDIPFDQAKVRASLKSIQETATKAKSVFPENSRTGNTEALPAAFENKADLFARFDKLAADAKSVESTITDGATLKAQWPKVFSACLSCHKQYVKPR